MDLRQLTDQDIYPLAQTIWDAMSRASRDIDYNTFCQAFSDALKQRISRERYESQCQEFPLLTSLSHAEPVACIRRSEGVTVIFRQFSSQLEGEFIGQLTLAGTAEQHEVVNAQVY